MNNPVTRVGDTTISENDEGNKFHDRKTGKMKQKPVHFEDLKIENIKKLSPEQKSKLRERILKNENNKNEE